ncbi:glycoside hydrolase family 13 protein [Skermania sp. ID1734]|uniref:glycoside hydrolase family 13 protein n=1 Tax=Skermania sp. ID1734 TaxID=2597516 RepID=UPI00117D9A92|nr:alpha-amylase family glycosyl hydrolase [Skermania sp. ID1734]TSD99989.1 glycoside hydrolase family 13 protein [Skermania sp. ID1734]
MTATSEHPWWREAVFYQVYPRSFADSNGDGVGDLAGIRAHLDYLEDLGIQAIWLCPVMRSPMADGGYDVSDPRSIDPLFGSLDDMDALIADAHARGIRVIMDVVPNHTSIEHPWFGEAVAAGRGSRARERYIFRDGRGIHGSEPPNNWPSIFGGSAWTRITEPDGSPGQWYLHLFAPEQPDLNWENPEVFEDLATTLRFWLDRGVDGFRIDVAHGLAKPEGLPDMTITDNRLLAHNDADIRFNDEGVHDIHRKIRKVIDEYPEAVTIGEVWVDDNARFGRYLRADELHLAFNFRLAETKFDARAVRDAIENSLLAVAEVGATPTWTLSNHDVRREVSRYGGGPVGEARARAMAMVELALPGAVFIYNGSELGLPNVDDLPEDVLQDPAWERSGHTERGRDGCRVPLPWKAATPPFGFTTAARSWLPIPPDWADRTVERQRSDPSSMVSFYRAALRLRAERTEFGGAGVVWLPGPSGAVLFQRPRGLICVLNAGPTPVELPAGNVLLASAPIVDGLLPTDSAAWLV